MSEQNLQLRQVGLKVTLPRIKILQILETTRQENRHLSAEDVYRQLLDSSEDVGLATVYRVLTQFEAAGLIIRHNFDGGHALFEMAPENHHDHMLCLETNEIIEFTDSAIEQRQKELAEARGYELVDHALILYVKPKSA